MDEPLSLSLWARYIDRECTAAEAAAVEAWLAQHPDDLAEAKILREYDTLSRARRPRPDFDGSWRALSRRVGLDTNSEPGAARHRVSSPARTGDMSWPQGWPRGVGSASGFAWRQTTIAAVVVVAAVVGGAVGLSRIGGHGSPHSREYATAAGQRATVRLLDGTQVTLGPASRLTVADNYGRGLRRVRLEGEALFAVIHDASRPFSVHTPRAVVQDVGTEFVVRAYGDDATEYVAVADGAVEVGRGALLYAGDVATVSGTRIVVTHPPSLARYFGWTQGRLIFDNVPLRDVAQELGRAFDVTVTLADSALGRELISGDLGDQGIDEILREITDVIGAQYQRDGRRVVIRHGRAATGWPGSGPPQALHTASAQAWPE